MLSKDLTTFERISRKFGNSYYPFTNAINIYIHFTFSRDGIQLYIHNELLYNQK